MAQEVERIRRQVWALLEQVARPDSRFHWDFTAFVPDFEGSEVCARKLAAMALYRGAGSLLVTPDNSLAALRRRALQDGKRLIVPTYALRRGFWQVRREDVPPGQEAYAACLDGLEVFGRVFDPFAREGGQDVLELVVTGASVLSVEGVRLSPGPSYFDLEWLMLRVLGWVTDETPVVAIVHDCQVVDLSCDPPPYASVVDLIITPTRTIRSEGRHPKPTSVPWDQIPWEAIMEIPLLRRLRRQIQSRTSPAGLSGEGVE